MVMRKIVFVVSAIFFLMLGTPTLAATTKHAMKNAAQPEVKTEAQSEVKTEIKPEEQSVVKAGPKIAVVDLNKVLLESPQLAKAKASFKKKFDAREKEVKAAQEKFRSAIETFSKNSPTMKPDVQKAEQQKIIEQQKKLQEMQAKLQEEATFAENNLLKELVKKAEAVINKLASERQYDLVVAKASLAYNKKELEITDEVSKLLKKQ